MEEKKCHSPLPWRVRDEIGDYIIEDANGRPVANPSGPDQDLRLVNAEFIVERVNAYDRLAKKNDMQHSIILDLMNALDDCWDTLHRVSDRAEEQRDATHETLNKARKAIKEEVEA